MEVRTAGEQRECVASGRVLCAAHQGGKPQCFPGTPNVTLLPQIAFFVVVFYIAYGLHRVWLHRHIPASTVSKENSAAFFAHHIPSTLFCLYVMVWGAPLIFFYYNVNNPNTDVRFVPGGFIGLPHPDDRVAGTPFAEVLGYVAAARPGAVFMSFIISDVIVGLPHGLLTGSTIVHHIIFMLFTYGVRGNCNAAQLGATFVLFEGSTIFLNAYSFFRRRTSSRFSINKRDGRTLFYLFATSFFFLRIVMNAFIVSTVALASVGLAVVLGPLPLHDAAPSSSVVAALPPSHAAPVSVGGAVSDTASPPLASSFFPVLPSTNRTVRLPIIRTASLLRVRHDYPAFDVDAAVSGIRPAEHAARRKGKVEGSDTTANAAAGDGLAPWVPRVPDGAFTAWHRPDDKVLFQTGPLWAEGTLTPLAVMAGVVETGIAAAYAAASPALMVVYSQLAQFLDRSSPWWAARHAQRSFEHATLPWPIAPQQKEESLAVAARRWVDYAAMYATRHAVRLHCGFFFMVAPSPLADVVVACSAPSRGDLLSRSGGDEGVVVTEGEAACGHLEALEAYVDGDGVEEVRQEARGVLSSWAGGVERLKGGADVKAAVERVVTPTAWRGVRAAYSTGEFLRWWRGDVAVVKVDSAVLNTPSPRLWVMLPVVMVFLQALLQVRVGGVATLQE